MLDVIFSSINLYMYLESSVLLTYILWRKCLAGFMKRSLNLVSAIPKYYLSGLLGSDTTDLYSMFAVKLLIIKWSFGSISTMVIRGLLKNSSVL